MQPVEDKLFFILFYFKCYPNFDVIGVLFDLHRSPCISLDAKTLFSGKSSK
ncbi:MAG: transposase family protein [Nostoc sp. NOS(2021)]|uniref:transposase family protein n=1 Tax=Nostoc sp. NOS(2021) TaxID=2815407 RepID=UPI0025EF4E0F|nr:transposase family protein [Nostoc sp. NOS(2021)]MBN3898729.1 transposase family protein [Nostoc sp. NOS(2021)]